ncbi:formate dehydrogenase accessory sulfurtransferase FdhD [Nocardioides fonticola]|uniref:Formate dehydrogenase accessory sulfurtransferase FdhD n=1 Tax=Nocardioides fonticola TaxID=450363 RepID=A0ABP7XV42_9ACTN
MSPGADRRPGPTVRVRVEEHLPERVSRHEDRVITEEPLEIRLAWPGAPAHRVWVTMRTPGHDFELAAGWMVHEGVAGPGHLSPSGTAAISGVAYCTDATLTPEQEFNVVTVTLDAVPVHPPGARHDAASAGSSACGVCGADSIEAVLGRHPGAEGSTSASDRGGELDGAFVRSLPDLLRPHQPLFDRTGGVHAAALVTLDGEVLVVREDVGRHNAVDKVTGARVLAAEPTAGTVLVVSGRAGFELVQKAIAAGTRALVAVGAPTSLSVRLARESGLGLYGFARADRVVRYC